MLDRAKGGKLDRRWWRAVVWEEISQSEAALDERESAAALTEFELRPSKKFNIFTK